MVSINKMLSRHAHLVLYLLQEIEFILSRTTSCICRFCRIERLYGRFPYSRMNFFRTTDTTDTTIWKPGFNCSHVRKKIAIKRVIPGLHCTICYKTTVTLATLAVLEYIYSFHIRPKS